MTGAPFCYDIVDIRAKTMSLKDTFVVCSILKAGIVVVALAFVIMLSFAAMPTYIV